MKIAIHGKTFAPEYDDAIKHILARIRELDPAPIVESNFKRILMNAWAAPRTGRRSTSLPP